MTIKTTVWRIRQDGVRQRYHTTAARMEDNGLEYDDDYKAWVDFSTIEVLPEEGGGDVIPPEEYVWLVAFYTDYKADKRTTRFEIRLYVRAGSETEAIANGLSTALDTLPDAYTSFLDAMGVFDANKSAEKVSETDETPDVSFFRYPSGEKRGEARKFRK